MSMVEMLKAPIMSACSAPSCGKTFWKTQSRASKFYFLSTNSISYETFETLLRPLRSKFGPLEVAEVTKVQAKKSSIKNPKLFNFGATSETFVLKKLKKSRFRDFRLKKIVIFCWSQLNFWKTCQYSKKWLYQLLVGMFME